MKDYHKALSKFAFRTHPSLFKNEQHIVLPNQIYHNCGPFTSEKRTNPETNQPYPDKNLAPIYQTDSACFYHDRAYRDAEKLDSSEKVLEAKHAADRELVKELKTITGKTWQENVAKAIALNAIKMKLNFGMSISPKLSDNPISDLDDICQFHNITEDNSLFQHLLQNYQPNNLKEGLVQKSLELLINPKFPFRESILDLTEKLGSSISHDKAIQIANEVHTPYRKGARRTVIALNKLDILAADIAEFPPVLYKRVKYQHVFVALNVFTKYAWMFI